LSPGNWELLRVLSDEALTRIQEFVVGQEDGLAPCEQWSGGVGETGLGREAWSSRRTAFIETLEKKLGSTEVMPKVRRGRTHGAKLAPKPISEFNSLKAASTPYNRPVKPLFTPDDFPSLQVAHSMPRPRSNTESYAPRKFSSPKAETVPSLKWTRPERETAVDFSTVQAQQKALDLSVNVWGNLVPPPSFKSIYEIQADEREEAELQEALRLISEMEAREQSKSLPSSRPRRRRKQTS
jgi:hypothetical protein